MYTHHRNTSFITEDNSSPVAGSTPPPPPPPIPSAFPLPSKEVRSTRWSVDDDSAMRVDWTPALGTVLEGVEGWSPDRYSAPAIDERHRLGPFVGDGVGEWSSDYSSTSDTDNGGLETPSSALFSVGKGDDTDNRNDSDLRLLGISIVESASNIDSEANSGCEPPACSVCCEPAVVTSLRPRAGVATLLRLGVGFAIWWGRRLDSW